MQSSPEINEIAGALALAQSAMSFAAKDSTNPHFKSRYADLYSVLDAIRPHLSAQGIAIVQIPSCVENKVSVETRLIHKSGQWIGDGGGAWATVRDMSPQSVGSVETYGRRYGLMAMCGIAPADDDGEAAQGRPQAPAYKPTPPPIEPKATPTPPKSTLPEQFDGAGQIKEIKADCGAAVARIGKERILEIVNITAAYCNRDGTGIISIPSDPTLYRELREKLAALK